jgi:hypothetical protein
MDEFNRLREDLRRALEASRFENIRSVEEARPLVAELLARVFGDEAGTLDGPQMQQFLDAVKREAILREEREG